MSLLGQLNAPAFEVFGQQVIRSDMAGNLLGLAALALGWRRSMLTWPVQLLSGAVLVSAYASAQLSGGVGKQVLVITVAVWGWTRWRRSRSDSGDGQIEVRFATTRERIVLVAGTAGATLAVGGLFTVYPSLSWNPWPDAYIFVGTMAAMFAQARGWVEFWFAWLAVDLVGVPLALSSGLVFSGLVYGVYFVLVILGLRAWWMRTREPRPGSSPGNGTVLEGAAA